MIQLADYLPRVRNFNVAVKEERGEVIFLRKIVPAVSIVATYSRREAGGLAAVGGTPGTGSFG